MLGVFSLEKTRAMREWNAHFLPQLGLDQRVYRPYLQFSNDISITKHCLLVCLRNCEVQLLSPGFGLRVCHEEQEEASPQMS